MPSHTCLGLKHESKRHFHVSEMCEHQHFSALPMCPCVKGSAGVGKRPARSDHAGQGRLCVHTYDLQFDGLPVQLDGADLEIHSDGADVALSVGVILNMNSSASDRGHDTQMGQKQENLLQSAAAGRTFLLRSPQSAGA